MADMDLFVGAENQFLICALRNDLCTIICSWFKSWSSIDIQCKYFRIFTLHHFCNSGYHCKPGVDLCVPDPDTRYIMQNWHLIVPIQFLKTNLSTNCAEKICVQKCPTCFLTQIMTKCTNQKSIPTPHFLTYQASHGVQDIFRKVGCGEQIAI